MRSRLGEVTGSHIGDWRVDTRVVGLAAALVGVLALGASVVVGEAAASPPAGTQAGTPTTRPVSSSKCVEGVTYKLLKPRKAHTLEVKATRANIRELPGLECPILSSVRRGKRLNATGNRARADKAVWREVKGKFGRGWIYEGLVRDA